jgi:hypothetical protein
MKVNIWALNEYRFEILPLLLYACFLYQEESDKKKALSRYLNTAQRLIKSSDWLFFSLSFLHNFLKTDHKDENTHDFRRWIDGYFNQTR